MEESAQEETSRHYCKHWFVCGQDLAGRRCLQRQLSVENIVRIDEEEQADDNQLLRHQVWMRNSLTIDGFFTTFSIWSSNIIMVSCDILRVRPYRYSNQLTWHIMCSQEYRQETAQVESVITIPRGHCIMYTSSTSVQAKDSCGSHCRPINGSLAILHFTAATRLATCTHICSWDTFFAASGKTHA